VQGILVAFIVLDALVLLSIIAVVVAVRMFSGPAKAAEATLDELRKELPATLEAAQGALRAIETLASQSRQEVQKVGDAAQSVDRLFKGGSVAEAAGRAYVNSRTTAASIVAGLKEGLRVLRTPSETTKEE
jgi:hypothetical protein